MGTYHKNALPIGYELAEYTIDAVLGHGGFGITYLARDNTLGALVAIKEYLPGEIAQRDSKMRVLPNPERQAVRDYQAGLKNFVKEARALAHFKHSHIVRVLRFLEANGTAYVVMEYEKGQSLADYLKHHGPRLDEAMILRVFIPILNGLHAVHDVKMLHLDIKPENIYLREDGRPLLIDFGSARRAMSDANRAQRIALTHGYAPIEQYPDKGAPGPWTDVYAIGASMYRCVSGKRPDDALSRYQAVLKYQTDPLTPAVKVGRNHYQPMLLECIDWAMQIYAKDRPQSAREMQDGLLGKRRQSATAGSTRTVPFGQPKPPSMPSPAAMRDMKKARLRWRVNAAIGAGRMLLTIIALGAAIVGVSFYWHDIEALFGPARERPAIQRPPAAQETIPETSVTASDKRAMTPEELKRAANAVPRTTTRRNMPVFERSLNGHNDWIQSLVFSPDSRLLASASNDGVIKIWSLESGAALKTLRGHQGSINAVLYSPDGKWLASAANDGSVILWDGTTGSQSATLRGSRSSLFTIAFSPDGTLLAAAGRDRNIYVWNVTTRNKVITLEGHTGDIFALAFAPGGKVIASAGADKTIRFWNPETGEAISTLEGQKGAVLALAFTPDGRLLVSGDSGQSVRWWDTRTFTQTRPLTDLEQPVLSLAFSPDGYWMVAGMAGKTIALFESGERTPTNTLSGHQDFVQSVAFSSDGYWLASGSRDRSVRLWRAK